jgi:hypothetical protein
VGEAIEIAGRAGTDLTGWSLVLYNGATSFAYDTLALSGVIPDQQTGFGTLPFTIAGIQNGFADGIALVSPLGQVVEFLSYEGVFTALGGPAAFLTSVDVGVRETSSTPVGFSLQRTGVPGGITWRAAGPHSFGRPNDGQVFPIPEPGSVALLAGGLLLLAVRRRRR